MNAEIAVAFGADVIIVHYILHIDRLPALIALAPQSLWDGWLIAVRGLWPVDRVDLGIRFFRTYYAA